MSVTPLPFHPPGALFLALLAMNGHLPTELKFRENTALAYTCTVYCITKPFRVHMGLVLFQKNSVYCNLLCGNEIEWNLVSTDTKETCHAGVLITWVSVLSSLSGKKLHRHMLY